MNIINSEKIESVEVRIVRLDGEYRIETVEPFGDFPLEWECREDGTRCICAEYAFTIDTARIKFEQQIDFQHRINTPI